MLMVMRKAQTDREGEERETVGSKIVGQRSLWAQSDDRRIANRSSPICEPGLKLLSVELEAASIALVLLLWPSDGRRGLTGIAPAGAALARFQPTWPCSTSPPTL
jgi:hypothetical protein